MTSWCLCLLWSLPPYYQSTRGKIVPRTWFLLPGSMVCMRACYYTWFCPSRDAILCSKPTIIIPIPLLPSSSIPPYCTYWLPPPCFPLFVEEQRLFAWNIGYDEELVLMMTSDDDWWWWKHSRMEIHCSVPSLTWLYYSTTPNPSQKAFIDITQLVLDDWLTLLWYPSLELTHTYPFGNGLWIQETYLPDISITHHCIITCHHACLLCSVYLLPMQKPYYLDLWEEVTFPEYRC